MAGRIPQEFIDELVNRVDIVDVIDERVPLKKAGKEYTACCPFHNEKTPSFTVSQQKQFYHCFGCGAHGTALGFLMEYTHMDFIEAVETLAARIGMEVPRAAHTGGTGKGDSLAPLYQCLDRCNNYYRKQLADQSGAQPARDYLAQRGLDQDTIETFAIGYCPPGWDNLMKALGKSGKEQKDLITTGMLIDKADKCYDRFRHRIMFPIRDRRGRVIGFGGRVLQGTADPKAAKYLNSPETPLFHKGRELYGLYEARQALRNIPLLLVVEGYMDVVSLAQFGIRYAVATLGTATTMDHLEIMFRTCDTVVFCFDGDRAGRQAAWRALENALPVIREGRQVNFMFLPDGEDPDTLVRKRGPQVFEELIRDAMALSEYMLGSLKKQVDITNVDGRARLVELARPLLAKLDDALYRDMLITQLAKLVQMNSEELQRHLQRDISKGTGPANTRHSAAGGMGKPQAQAPSPVRTAITLLLHRPSLGAEVDVSPALARLQRPGISLLMSMLDITRDNPHLGSAALVERFRDTEHGQPLARLASWQPPYEEEGLRQEYADAIRVLERQLHDARCQELETKTNLSDIEKDELKQLHRELAG